MVIGDGSTRDDEFAGAGWLFRRKGLLLAVMFTAGGDDSEDPSVATTAVQTTIGTAGSGGPTDWIHVAEGGDRREGLSPHEWSAGTPGMVTVVGLREGADGELSDCNSRDLSMLLRLQGPEALAEVLFNTAAASTAAAQLLLPLVPTV